MFGLFKKKSEKENSHKGHFLRDDERFKDKLKIVPNPEYEPYINKASTPNAAKPPTSATSHNGIRPVPAINVFSYGLIKEIA